MDGTLEDISEFVLTSAWLPLVAGGALLLFGWYLYWTSIHVAGAGIFGGIFLLLATFLASRQEWSPDAVLAVQAGAAVVGVIAGIVIVRQAHRMIFLVWGGLVTGVLLFLLLQWAQEHVDGLPGWLEGRLALAFVPPVGAVLGGFLLLRFDRVVIAASTALLGALLACQGLGLGTGALPVLPFAAAGFVFQMVLGRVRRGRRKRAAAEED